MDNDDIRRQASAEGSAAVADLAAREQVQWIHHIATIESLNEGHVATARLANARADFAKAMANLISMASLAILAAIVVGTIWAVRHW